MATSFIQIFEDIHNAKSQKQRGELLNQYRSDHLEQILWYAFHPDVKWLVPEGDPPFTRSAEDKSSTLLYSALRRIRYFCEGPGGDNFCMAQKVNNIKRETMFIGLLEELTPDEADIVLQMKNKNFDKVNGLTYKLDADTFPFLIPPLKPKEN